MQSLIEGKMTFGIAMTVSSTTESTQSLQKKSFDKAWDPYDRSAVRFPVKHGTTSKKSHFLPIGIDSFGLAACMRQSPCLSPPTTSTDRKVLRSRCANNQQKICFQLCSICMCLCTGKIIPEQCKLQYLQ